MQKINVVPRPNAVTYTGGIVCRTAFDNVFEYTVYDPKLGGEGYCLKLEPSCVTITANTAKGLFYARKTLEQLKAAETIPCVTIEDVPRFSYRGFMLDSARHMQKASDIKKIVDAAALLKFNVFHWHLSDDQGFRIESEKFPELNEKGSWREGDDFGSRHVAEPYGGFYTKDEIRDIVAYCAERFIEVIPEIDVPGHTTALISTYPQLSCHNEQIAVKTKQGIFEDILCAGKDETLKFVYELLGEIIELFPSENFHIGGDEAPKIRWKECPECQAKIRELGLENEEELQGWFTSKIIEFLAEKGKKAIVWNESLAGGNLPEGTAVQMWMDPKKNCITWANRGNAIINSDFYHYYCDYPYYMTPLKKTYNFSPVPKGVAPIMERFVLGVECPMWTEHVYSFEWLCYMAFPRFAAVAERGWTKDRLCDCADFENRFTAIMPLIKEKGVYPAPKNEWNYNPAKRLGGTLRFFADKIDFELVANSLKNMKK